jgi:endonuclease YncB( thermonuclease family)
VTVLDLRALAAEVGTPNRYVGTHDRQIDGDTIVVKVLDPLLSVPVILTVRIMGINTPDRGEPGFLEVNAALAAWLPVGRVVTLTGVKPDKYAGRVDAAVATADGTDVAGWLLEHGYAVPWTGTGVRPLVPWPPSTGI